MCEAFSCRPSQAMREIEDAPVGLIESILTLRSYAANLRDYQAACQRNDEKGANADRFASVRAHEFAIHQEEIEARRARKGQQD